MDEHNPDEQLVRRVAASDEEAFRLLFVRYQPILFHQTLFQVKDPDAAHEVVQETFVRIWDRRRSLKPGLSFLGYALRISGNIVRDAARHHAMRERVASRVPPPARSVGDDPSEALDLSLLEEKVTAIVNNDLPDRCRTIFLLSRFDGKGNREIAELLGLSVKTVENQINHALKILRKKLPPST